ncbi:MAG: hypothetical protein ACQERS_14960 [Bacteroidota bacterium]
MKTQIVLFFVLLIVAMGCEKSTSSNEETLDPELLLSPFFGYTYTGDLPENQSPLKSASVTKTIKFQEASGVIEFQEGDCAPNINVRLTGYGQSSLMGKYHILNTFCSDGVDPVTSIYGFLTAANGDEIHTMVTDAGYNEEGELLYYVYTVLEGTGRFENIVSGEMIITGTMDFESLTWTCEGEGTLIFQYN